MHSLSAVAQLCEVSEVERSGCRTLSAQHVGKIFQPLSVAVMMLMALSFIFGPLRSVPMGVRVVTGISFGFVFYVLDQIFGPLTLVYGIPPIIGALLPSASFFLISLWLLMRKS